MERVHSIIDIKRLELLLKFINPKDQKNLDKRIQQLYKGFSPKSLMLVDLLNRFNDPNFNINLLPAYDVGNREVVIINNNDQIKDSITEILKEKYVGFDTEQKPSFKKGEGQNDIAIIQIATKKTCYIFQMKNLKNRSQITDIISNKNIKKIGFGLKNDNREIYNQFHINPINIVDLSPMMKKNFLHKNQIGAKNTVGLFLLKKMQKSKNVALTNWENHNLTQSQIKYASEDATAPYDVYENMILNYPDLLK